MEHTLPKLPYDKSALEPRISPETIDYHYGKHHQTYVTNLNKLITGTEFEQMTLEQIINCSTGGIFNNAAQIWNHSFYWRCLSPDGGGSPSGALADAINSAFGSYEKFKETFSTTAVTTFGSGWAWLVKTADGSLEIKSMSNAGNPITEGLIPIITCDVWEHAYYIDYRNARPKYVEAFFEMVNWDFAMENFSG
jgi:Fe-Mn family superoxide dismutase